MAIRTSQANVLLIATIDLVATPDITAFMETANMLVDDLCLTSDYSAAKLEMIERWLSAHFYKIKDMAVDSEKADVVSQKFQYKVDLKLDSTMYGQQAMMVDTAGNLANWNESAKMGNKGMTVGMDYLGTAIEDETAL